MSKKVKLHAGQMEVANDKHRYRVICAGRRWGKSTVTRMIVLKWALEKVGVYYIVSPTYKQAKSIHWLELKKEVPKLWVTKTNEVEMSMTLANGSIIELKGAENPDSLRGVKLRGLVIDEIASIRNWDWLWNEVLRPTLTDYQAPAIFISTPSGFNHFHTLYRMGQMDSDVYDEDYKSWHFTSYDNPFIPKEDIDKAKKELPEDIFMQEYMADFRRHEGLIYKDFDRDVHVIKPFDIPEDWRIFRGMDFGSNNPTVCLWVAEDNDGNLFVVDEYYQTHEVIEYHVGVIKSNKLNPQCIATYGDPSGTQWLLEFQSRGLYITPASRETGQSNQSWVTLGIEKVQELIKPVVGHYVMIPHMQPRNEGLPRLFVTSNCEKTIEEFEKYRWKQRANKDDTLNELDIPEKADDHCFVKGTKVITKRGSINIEDVVSGDFVWSPFGWNEVLKAGISGVKNVKDYGVLKCTPDHKIATQRGFVEVDTLSNSDIINVCQKPYSTKEFLTGVTQMPLKEQIGFILGGLLTKGLVAQRDFYTGKYGKTISGKFLRVISSITLMGTVATMILKTLSAYLFQNTLKSINGVFGKVWKNILRVSQKKQRSGINQKKVENGIVNTQKNNGKEKQEQKKNVLYVEQNTKLISPQEAGIVVTNAKQDIEEVYNLGTKYGCYYANNILVSNCLDALRYIVVSYRRRSNRNGSFPDDTRLFNKGFY